MRLVPRLAILRRGFSTTKQYITMPDVMDSREGVVEKWHKREGEVFSRGESLCDVSLIPSDLLIAVDSSSKGILARILVEDGKKIATNEPIAIYFNDRDEYMSFLDEDRISTHDDEGIHASTKVIEDKKKAPDMKVLMREIKHLLQKGDIEEGSDFAKKLQSHARKGNKQLMTIFEASFEGASFDPHSFDSKFFLDNAHELIRELEAEEDKNNN